ncbi:hypothetical protein DICVIV_06267 [Dictyocaulus viviparus]|uniref:Uncharacterized protein n=1 Tax=Dictyocaulus viviparus TaxID=29172 RepID=A0A0D8XUZ3_DICVI|nr:hypothetical protein DICVIV_06267 [Dictyocaulus viviparus]
MRDATGQLNIFTEKYRENILNYGSGGDPLKKLEVHQFPFNPLYTCPHTPNYRRLMSEKCKKLSSTVLEMKFMQRTKKKMEARQRKKQEAETRENLGSDEIGVSERKQSRFQYSNNLAYLQSLRFGRMSFGGCNPEIEKLMLYYGRKTEDNSDKDSDNGKDIEDRDMAKALVLDLKMKIGFLSEFFCLRLRHNTSRKLNLRESEKLAASTFSNLSEISGAKLNFVDVRKRGARDTWADLSSTRKHRKSY